MTDALVPLPFPPTWVYRGPWDPTRHDATAAKLVTSGAALREALADGWRRRPDVVDPGEGGSSEDVWASEPAALSVAPVVSQEPKRRGPGRPKRE